MRYAPVIYARTPKTDYADHLTFAPDGIDCGVLFPPVRDSIQDLRGSLRRVCIRTDGAALMGVSGRLEDMLAGTGAESMYLQLDSRRQVCFIGALVEYGEGETPGFPDIGMLLKEYESLMGDVWDLPGDAAELDGPLATEFQEYGIAVPANKGRPLPRGMFRCVESREGDVIASALTSAAPVSVCVNGGSSVFDGGSFDAVGVRAGLLDWLLHRGRYRGAPWDAALSCRSRASGGNWSWTWP